MSEELGKIAAIHFIDPGKARFYALDGDFLGLDYDGIDRKRVSVRRALPMSRPDEYLCVLDADDKEIGIIRSLEGFADDQKALVVGEIAMRYYTPTVSRILSAKEKMYLYFDLETSAGPKTIAVKDVMRSVRQLDDKRVLLTDVDGNRFLIPDVAKLDRASMRLIETYLF